MNKLLPVLDNHNRAPALLAAAGERAQTRFWEFFVSTSATRTRAAPAPA